MERKGFFNPIEVKEASEGIVSGYLANWNSVDSDGDIFASTAFNKSISERGVSGTKQIKYLLDHDTRKAVGVFTKLEADNTGLYYEAKIGSHAAGRDYLEMCKSEIIKEHSVGFRILKRDKTDNRIITEGKLYEGSGLQFLGANSNTPLLGIKSESDFTFDDLDYFLYKLEKSKDVDFIGKYKTRFTEFLKSVEQKEAELFTSESYNPTKEDIIKFFTKNILI